jgi:hypothetical protein
MKVALVLADADLPLIHDLKVLLRQVRKTGTEPPQDILDTAWLTPWAAELRYDEADRVRSRRSARSGRERKRLGGVAAGRREAPRSRSWEEISGGSSASSRALEARKPWISRASAS